MKDTAKEGAFGMLSLKERMLRPTHFELSGGPGKGGKGGPVVPLWLKAEVEMHSIDDGAEFINLMQHLEREDDKRIYGRFGYYRRVLGERQWFWGSQTSLTLPIDELDELIKKARTAGLLK